MRHKTRPTDSIQADTAPWRFARARKAPRKDRSAEHAPYGYFHRERISTTFAFLNRDDGTSPGDGSTPVGLPDAGALRDRASASEPPEYVWTPQHPDGVASVLCPALTRTLAMRQEKAFRSRLAICGLNSLLFFALWLTPGGQIIFLVFSLLFGLIPFASTLYEVRNFRQHPLRHFRTTRESWLFQQWLRERSSPTTFVLIGALCFLGCIHFFYTGMIAGIEGAGLDPTAIGRGEIWRLLTGPLIHANFVHIAFNLLALWAFGRIIERFCGGGIVLFVFTLSMLVGAVASWITLDGRTSVGASGGVLGLLAFIAVFAGRNPSLFPRNFATSLGYNLMLIALLGLVLFEIIDNAAHLGGVIAGTLIGFLLSRANSGDARASALRFVHRLTPPLACLLAGAVLYTAWALIEQR